MNLLTGHLSASALAEAQGALHAVREQLSAELRYLRATAGEHHASVGILAERVQKLSDATAELDRFGLGARSAA